MKILIDDEYTDKATERLDAGIVDTPSDNCARCDWLDTKDAALLPMGVGARHAWLHSRCRYLWAERRRADAVVTLARLGIVEPRANALSSPAMASL
jgi:hypothetical protein